MANDGNYLAGMLAAGQQPAVNAVGQLGQGIDLGQKIGQIPMQNALQAYRMKEINRASQTQDAVAHYAQTGDIKPLQALDPALAMNAMKSNDYIKSQPPEKIRLLSSAMNAVQNIAPMINENNWKEYRKTLMQSYPGLDPSDLPPDNATEAQLHQFKYGSQLALAQIKASGTTHTVPPGGELTDAMGRVLHTNPNLPVGMQPTQLISPTGGLGPKIPAGTHVQIMPSQSYDIWQNPDNPNEAGYFTKGINPGQPGGPPTGWVPQKQGMVLQKEEKQKDTIDSVAQMLINNEMNPDMVSGRGMNKNDIIAAAKKKDPSYNPAKQRMYWYDAQKRLAALDSTQMQKMETGGLRVIHTVDEIKTLANQLNGKQSEINSVAKTAPANLGITGIGPLNKAKLDYYIKLRGNTPEGMLATKYVTAINDMRDLIATNATGGYAPTDPAWKLALEQMNQNFGVEQMGAAVDELKKLVEININAGRQLRSEVIEGPSQSGPGQYQTPMPYKSPPVGGGQPSETTSPGDYYNTFKESLISGDRKKAIDFARKHYPQYIERAKKEGAL